MIAPEGERGGDAQLDEDKLPDGNLINLNDERNM